MNAPYHPEANCCKYEWCWLYGGKWSEHGGKTGGWYACNIHEKLVAEGKNEEELAANKAKAELERPENDFTRYTVQEKIEAIAEIKNQIKCIL